MSFELEQYLLLLILIPLFSGILYWNLRTRERRLQRYADKALFESLILNWNPVQSTWQHVFWSLAVSALIIAVARPTWGLTEEIVEAEGLAIVAVLDVSRSMDAQDIYPSRLERAKRTANEIFQAVEGNQLGLVLFAGSAFVQLPLTTDSDTASMFLNAATSHSIGRQGTALADALELAVSIIDQRIVSNSVILVLSDGENHQGDPVLVAEAAAARGIVIHTIGYGDPIDGEPIPVMNPDGTFANEYKTDVAGRLVLSRLNEGILNGIAEVTLGIYQRASGSGIETVNILNEIHKIEGTLIEKRLQTRKIERFGFFVGLAVIAIIMEIVIAHRGARKNESRHKLVSIACFLLMLSGCGEAAKHNYQGSSNFQSGSYDAALQAFQRAQVAAPDEATSYFNAASAQIAMGSYDSAVSALQQALKTADTAIAAAALYNLGNTFYELREYYQAVEAYQAALRHNPNDADARYNLELALLFALQPSPTAQEQQTIPDAGVTDPTVTPTDQPGGSDGPTPTPPPMEFAPSATPMSGEGLGGDADSSTPVPLERGGMTVEQAENFLDQIQVDQRALSEFLSIPISGGQLMENDW